MTNNPDSKAPERIWVSDIAWDLGRSGDLEPMGFAWNMPHGRDPKEYTRTDAITPQQAAKVLLEYCEGPEMSIYPLCEMERALGMQSENGFLPTFWMKGLEAALKALAESKE